MPIYHRSYSPGKLQFITTSTYRRAPVFLSPRFCLCLVQCLEEEGSADHRLCGPRLFGQMFSERRTADRKGGGPRYLLMEIGESSSSRVTGDLRLPLR